jgi:SAM-dependent methyltransferase
VSTLADTVAARYRGATTRGFVRGKLKRDPVVPALLALPPLGDVLDLGCGRGQLGLALVLTGRARSIIGLDLDAAKIARASAAAQGLPARFAVADLATASLPPCDTALLIDALVQMHPPAQAALLARIVADAPARIVIRAFDPDRGWRSALGLTIDRLRRRLGGDLGLAGTVAPQPIATLRAPLEAAGYAVSVTPCWAGTPLPNVLLLAQRT